MPDLSGPSVEVILESATPNALRDLNLSITALSNGNLNINWNFQNFTGVKKPFEVPSSIIDNKHEVDPTAKLSNFVTFTQDATGPMSLSVKNAAGTEFYQINGFVLTELFNSIEADALTDPVGFNGVMGLVEQVSGSLFLPNGIYSLWSLDTADPSQDSKLPGKNMYGVHPFFMGRATDKSWFGVFLNLAAA